MNLTELNTILVASELKSLYSITKGIINCENNSIVSLGFFNYVILLSVEICDYANETYGDKLTYKYKRKIKECRARIKEYNIESSEILALIEKTNVESIDYFYKDLSKLVQMIFGSLITNLGIYKYNDKIISNTFLISKDLKPIIYNDRKIDKKRIKEVSTSLGMLLNTLYLIFYKDVQVQANVNIKYNFVLEDYNVRKKNNLLNPKINNNEALFFLDILSILNFCKEIIYYFEICDELKYRIFYLAFYRTYHNTIKLVEKDDKYLNINNILKKYYNLDNKVFRNAMFHYNITDKINSNEIKFDQMYYGIIFKYLKMSDIEYKKSIINYFTELSSAISNIILFKK
ncbi:MAG: hypothetical protein IJ068_04615 [Bacilli bacterium]|nr:hypothetical protein [Bacilli bacterium]